MSVWTQGKRKLVYGSMAFVALCGASWPLHATFTEFRDGMIVWLGAVLTAHITAEKLPTKVSPPGGAQ